MNWSKNVYSVLYLTSPKGWQSILNVTGARHKPSIFQTFHLHMPSSFNQSNTVENIKWIKKEKTCNYQTNSRPKMLYLFYETATQFNLSLKQECGAIIEKDHNPHESLCHRGQLRPVIIKMKTQLWNTQNNNYEEQKTQVSILHDDHAVLFH